MTVRHSSNNYQLKIQKAERFLILNILRDHKFYTSHRRPTVGQHWCYLIVAVTHLQLQHLFLNK